MHKFTALGICLSLAVATGMMVSSLVKAKAETSGPPVAASEFVCYDDGKLTERHVGVQYAYVTDSYGWRLRYVDQDGVFYYIQKRGETCGVEK